jgi:hypothetical protein
MKKAVLDAASRAKPAVQQHFALLTSAYDVYYELPPFFYLQESYGKGGVGCGASPAGSAVQQAPAPQAGAVPLLLLPLGGGSLRDSLSKRFRGKSLAYIVVYMQ